MVFRKTTDDHGDIIHGAHGGCEIPWRWICRIPQWPGVVALTPCFWSPNKKAMGPKGDRNCRNRARNGSWRNINSEPGVRPFWCVVKASVFKTLKTWYGVDSVLGLACLPKLYSTCPETYLCVCVYMCTPFFHASSTGDGVWCHLYKPHVA